MAGVAIDAGSLDPEKLLNLTVQFNYDPLKQALAYVLAQVRENSASIARLQGREPAPA